MPADPRHLGPACRSVTGHSGPGLRMPSGSRYHCTTLLASLQHGQSAAGTDEKLPYAVRPGRVMTGVHMAAWTRHQRPKFGECWPGEGRRRAEGRERRQQPLCRPGSGSAPSTREPKEHPQAPACQGSPRGKRDLPRGLWEEEGNKQGLDKACGFSGPRSCLPPGPWCPRASVFLSGKWGSKSHFTSLGWEGLALPASLSPAVTM